MDCTIPANPDISGVGVRVAIYIQNLLSFIPAFWALSDGIVTSAELKTVEKQSMSILIMAFAILISSIVQAGTFALSDFHTSIILSLSWMNNTNTFIYFLLYVGYKSHENSEGAMVKPQLKTWFNHINDAIRCRSHMSLTDAEAPVTADSRVHDGSETQDLDIMDSRRRSKGLAGWMKSSLTIFRHRIVLTLGSLHLTVMSILGLWLWASPILFEVSQESRTNGKAFAPSESLPVYCTRTALMGFDVPILSPVLRYVSLVIYTFFLAPGLNMLIPAIFFLVVFVGSHDRRLDKVYSLSSRLWLRIRTNLLAIPVSASDDREQFTETDASDEKPNLTAIWGGLIILVVVNIVFLADIETAIHHAKQNNHLLPGESEWTFGQTLALILLVLPLRDVIDYGAIQEQIRHDRAKKATKALKEAILNGNSKLACRAAKYADNVFMRPSDHFPSVLSFAAQMGNLDLAQLMLARYKRSEIDIGVMIDLPDDSGLTPLGLAARKRDRPMVRLLLKHNADVSKAANYCLIHAAESGHELLARRALQHGANVNWADGSNNGQTPLTCAARNGYKLIVRLLLDHDANIDQAENDGKTSLIHAVREEHRPIVRLLLRRGAKVNQADKDGKTPLRWAAYKGHGLIAALLLERGANIDDSGTDTYTPLMEAAYWGRTQVMAMLLSSGADLEHTSAFGQTALFRAISGEQEAAVQLLLEQGADFHKVDNHFQTPLRFARKRGYLGIVKLLKDADTRQDKHKNIPRVTELVQELDDEYARSDEGTLLPDPDPLESMCNNDDTLKSTS